MYGALKDLIVVDKHRMFYKGLFPIMIAFTNLSCIPNVIEYVKSFDLRFS